MNGFMCAPYVEEEKNEHYLAYVLKQNDYFYSTLYQIVKKNPNDFVPCYELMQNGHKKILYDVSALNSYAFFAEKMMLNDFKHVIGNIVETLKRIKDNGFVQLEAVNISKDDIYINMQDYTVRFICAPLNISSTRETYKSFEKMLLDILSNMIMTSKYRNDPVLQNYIRNVSVEKVTLDELYTRFQSGFYGECLIANVTNTAPDTKGRAVNAFKPIRLITINGQEEIIINKVPFSIGKQEGVDHVVRNAIGVSRVHCEINYINGQFYIVDKRSTNGTYVNGMIVQPETNILIHKRDEICMGDFKVVVD